MGKIDYGKTMSIGNLRLEYNELLFRVEKQRDYVGLIQDPKVRKRAFNELRKNENKLNEMRKALFGNL